MKKARPTPKAALSVQFTGEEQAERQQEQERVMELGRKLRDNYQRHDQALHQMPSTDLYSMEPSSSNGLVQASAAAPPNDGPPNGTPSLERQRLQQQMLHAGAASVYLPQQEIRPLCDYLKDRYAPSERERTLALQEEQEEEDQRNRVLNNSERSLSLQRGGTHPAGTLEQPLPPEDPAAETLNRLNIQTLELVRWFEGRWQYHAGKAGIRSEDRLQAEQYACWPAHVAQVSTEAYEPFEPCFLGTMCFGVSRLNHPQGRFPFMRYLSPTQWQDWQRTGKKPTGISSTCYYCYLFLVHFMVDENIRKGNRSSKVYPAFYSPVDTPGGYNRAAIRPAVEGYTNGVTRPLRTITPSSMVPCMRKVRRMVTDSSTGQTRLEEVQVRGFLEDDSVLFLDGARQTSALAHQPMQPPSYTVTRITTPLPSAVNVLRHELLDADRAGVMREPRLDLRAPIVSGAAATTSGMEQDSGVIGTLRQEEQELASLISIKLESEKV